MFRIPRIPKVAMVLLLSAGIQIPLVGSYNTCAAEKKQAMPSWAQYKVIDIHTHIGTFRGFDLSSQTLLVNLKARGVKMASFQT